MTTSGILRIVESVQGMAKTVRRYCRLPEAITSAMRPRKALPIIKSGVLLYAATLQPLSRAIFFQMTCKRL
ncbi:hypothetical protein CU100_01855 [Phyllobacterium endophyticum]|uniref:Uncharacterized protein n=1 Tax=Phyllobacterium endophyticum TaxID=1149773 RepID=A0A2P7AZ98_9HYPH|nr:hypothetical protein CU100_01855 [Phyllobacterium endophyticum]